MKRFQYILLLVAASLLWSCVKFDENGGEITADGSSQGSVEVLDDGRIQVTAALNGVSMTSVVTRATSYEDAIYNGWCLVFGEDQTEHGIASTDQYTDSSPLIQVVPIVANENGTFTMIFDEYPNVSFMRIVVNMTDRENTSLGLVNSWASVISDNGLDSEKLSTPPDFDEVSEYGIATFRDFRYQSVGLDGIYNMGTNWYTTKAVLYHDLALYTDLDKNETTTGVVYETATTTNTGYSTIHGTAESYNDVQPNPANVKTTGFPMASYGFVMKQITAESLKASFGNQVDMIRTCSKVAVNVEDDTFTIDEVYLIDAAQEARIRSTVLSDVTVDDDGNSSAGASTEFTIPQDLGGTITYLVNTNPSDPIYFYPNKGGSYTYVEDVVNQDVNPQYIVIKGKSSNYDTPGYYKVALKAQYPLSGDSTEDNMNDTSMWSALTYDILRNTSFTVNLNNIDKPGYKTLKEAADVNSPANNISYSITIESSDNYYEILVSKGTYYTELETSRVYVKGYMDEGIDGCYLDFTMTPSTGNTVPTVYVQSSDLSGDNYDGENVVITHCQVLRKGDTGYDSEDWSNAKTFEPTENDTDDDLGEYMVKVYDDSADGADAYKATKVRLNFDVNASGRIRLRIGDILKFIPVVYDRAPISMYGTKGQGGTDADDKGVIVSDEDNDITWDDFSYSKVEYDESYVGDDDHTYIEDFKLNANGTVTYDNTVTYYEDGQEAYNNYTTKPELRARIYPSNAGDGIAVLYLRQASDFKLTDADGDEILDDSESDATYEVIFHSQSEVMSNDTHGLFTESDDKKSIIFSTSNLSSQSVDALTISIDTEITTKDEDGNDPGWAEYFDEEISDDGQTLTLSATTILYDYEGLDLTGVDSDDHEATRQAYVAGLYTTFVLYNNTATSVITVANSAGDTKTYTVYQTQYPPIYLVDASGQTTKSFSISSSANSGVCVFALSIWNYEINGGDITTTHSVTGYNSNSQSAFNSNVMKCEFDSNYINSYDWSGDSSSTIVSATTFGGTSTSTTAKEINNMGGYSKAEHIYGVVRNKSSYSSSLYWYYYADAILYITVTDDYGYTYKTTKYLKGTF